MSVTRSTGLRGPMPDLPPVVQPFRADTGQYMRTCRIIARHLTALADELESLDSPVPPAADDPAPFTIGAFLHAFEGACVQAWDKGEPDGARYEPGVTLPDGLWPELEIVLNPITRSPTRIHRVPMFAWGEKRA